MNTLDIYPFCEALAVGLLHSLWSFPLLAGLSWLLGKQLAESRHRYRLHLVTLLSCLGAFLFVVGRRWWSVSRLAERVADLEGQLSGPLIIEIVSNFEPFGVAATTKWTVYVVALYTLGLLAMLFRYGRRYAGTLRMRRGGLLPAPEWRATFNQLRAEVHPGGRADWRITDRVREVLVVGVLRPVILFPVGLINQLTADEVTAILRHELTHLRRHDPFWNAVQEMIRALFFYHPAVHWLCAELDREREYACDDAVLLQTNPGIYARALLRVANYSLNPINTFTMAAADTSNLSLRVKRLFSPAAPRPSLLGRANFLPPLAVLPLLLLLAYALANPYQLGAQTTVAATDQAVTISGTVTDGATGQPLIGTAIVVPDANTGAITDIDGNYTIKLPAGKEQLIFSYVGYKTLHFTTYPFETATANVRLFTDKEADVEIEGSEAQVILLVDSERDYGNPTDDASEQDEETSTFGGISPKTAVFVDGKRLPRGSLDNLEANRIEAVKVIKDRGQLDELGLPETVEGAILITTKK